jgi:hypothetical protein
MRALYVAVALALPMAAAAAETNDLRTLRIGTAAAGLPAEGFAGFACAASPDKPLSGWQDWQTCPADPAGRHAIRFRYAGEDTKVAGHPVLLTALFDPMGRLDGLDIATDPAAPLFLRKKAFLLGLQARARYGEDGWSCTDGTPDANAEPVGGVFIEQTCHKRVDDREITVSRTLLRRPGTDLKAFVGESHISVMAAQP